MTWKEIWILNFLLCVTYKKSLRISLAYLRRTWPPAWWRRSMLPGCTRRWRWAGCPWRRQWWPWETRRRTQWRWTIPRPQPTPNHHPAGVRGQDMRMAVASLVHLRADYSLETTKQEGQLNFIEKHLCVIASVVWLSDRCRLASWLAGCSRLTLRSVDTIKVQMNQWIIQGGRFQQNVKDH